MNLPLNLSFTKAPQIKISLGSYLLLSKVKNMPVTHTFIKGTQLTQKLKLADNPQFIRVCFFIRFGEMCVSEWVPSERESDKNITALQSISQHQKLKQIQH